MICHNCTVLEIRTAKVGEKLELEKEILFSVSSKQIAVSRVDLFITNSPRIANSDLPPATCLLLTAY
jgi:hypothetical protein